MTIDVGPLPGNGVVFHASDNLAVGYCVVESGEIGPYVAGMFNVGQGWVEGAVLCLLVGAQDICDQKYGGNLGVWEMECIMKPANFWAKGLVHLNPHPAVVHATDPITPENVGAAIFEYTEGYLDADGHPQFRYKNYVP